VSHVRKANAALKYGSVNFSLVLEHNSRHILYLSGLYPENIYFIKNEKEKNYTKIVLTLFY